MDTSTFSQIITGLKTQLFGVKPFNRESTPCFIFTADIGLTDYGYAKDGNTQLYDTVNDRRSFCFVFCNNTTVFATNIKGMIFIDPSDINRVIKIKDFEHLSDHDSCWRGEVDRYLNKIYFEMFENVSVHREAAGEKPRAVDYRPFLWDFKIATGTLNMSRVEAGRSKLESVTVDSNIQVK